MDGTNKQTFGYKDKVRQTAGEFDVSMLTTPRGIAHLFGRTYILDTGDPSDDSTGEIRAFVDGARDTENDVGATNDIKSIGAIRRFGAWSDSVVGGMPYLIEFDRIQINSAKLEYVRMSDMTAADISKARLYAPDAVIIIPSEMLRYPRLGTVLLLNPPLSMAFCSVVSASCQSP